MSEQRADTQARPDAVRIKIAIWRLENISQLIGFEDGFDAGRREEERRVIRADLYRMLGIEEGA